MSQRIFISYSRADGRAFAEAFGQRLAGAGITSWRDLKDMGGGDIRPQVLRAIEEVKHFVLILSRRALASDWIKREWSHARMMGKRVSPVLADPGIRRSDLPAWIRREEVFEIDTAERWTQLVRILEGPGEVRRAPWMPGDVPDGFVPRPAEYQALKDAVLAAPTDKAVALTTALRGAGGYGKTTLANVLCRDPDVRFEFTDGILRVEIGKERGDVIGLVIDLIEKLDPGGKRPGFQDVVTAGEHLAELIGESRILLVIDDVWREAQLRPFLKGGPNCVRLVTTRLPQVLPASCVPIPIDEMRAAEALSLIGAGLPGAEAPALRQRLATLADRLGNWAQMLGIANGWMRARIADGEALAAAITRFEQRLAKRGLTGFDPNDETQRNKAIRTCVEASLEDLKPHESQRFAELAILPEDETVPLRVIEALWREAAGTDEDDADELIRRFNALSLLQSLDLGSRTVRLHDNMIWYLRDRIGPEGCRTAHAAMVRAIGAACDGEWAALPAREDYGWRFLIRHLRAAGQDDEADRLLTSYAWVKAKLHASDAQALFDSYLPESPDEGARLIGRAIALSVPALAANKRELARQLYGRLGDATPPAAASIVEAARQDREFHPAPRWPGLTPPGAERLRLVGHAGAVNSAGFSPDGKRIVTASADCTARLWDATTGQEIAALRGHEGWVLSAAFSPDGKRVVTASRDGTARLWDATTGQQIAAMRGHDDWVQSAAFSPDGKRIVTASSDRTARLWDATTGQEIAALRGHEAEVQSAGFSPDGNRILTASYDRTARIWDASTGQQIAALRGHDNRVWSAAFSPDGKRIVTASHDRTARLWDATTGQQIAALRGHDGWVLSAGFSPDGKRIVTASHDRTARLWDAATGQEIAARRGHDDWLQSAGFSPDGNRILTASDDRTARLWDANTGQVIAARRGHDDWVRSAGFSPDGNRILTASDDRTARLWDAATGQQVAALRGDDDWVRSAGFSPDGNRIVTASNDGTARLWDATTGQQIAALRGHYRAVQSAGFSPDGKRIVTASDDRTARLWDATTGQQIAELRGHDDRVWSAGFSPDGKRIVTVSDDRTARLWDATTGQRIVALRGHDGGVWSAGFSPDGKRIVTASDVRTARLWDAATGQQIAVLRGHDDEVQSAGFSPDGNRIVTVSDDQTARLWDATTGQQIAALRGHDGRVRSAGFSPDGNRIVTASDDRTARLWDAATGQEIARISLDAAVAALDVRGGLIALGDLLGRIHVFEAEEFLCAEGSVHG